MKRVVKIFGFGLLLFVATLVLLFAMSVVTGQDQPIDYARSMAVVAVFLGSFRDGFHCN